MPIESYSHRPVDGETEGILGLLWEEEEEQVQRSTREVWFQRGKGLLAAALVLSVIASGAAFAKNALGSLAADQAVGFASKTCGPSSCTLKPKGPSSAYRPTNKNCQWKTSCRNWGVWHLNGRLGNRLTSVGATLLEAAQLNLCYAYIPPDDLAYLQVIVDIDSSESLIDMADGGTPTPYWWNYPNHDNCVSYAWTPYEVAETSQLMQDYFVSTGRLKCNVPNISARPELGPDGVVIHMRSGDVMQPSTPSGFDPQPPCNFYSAVLEHGNNGGPYAHALIVTQPDKRNPCVEAISTWFESRVTVQSSTVQEDACMIATTQNLAIASFSTFDTGTVRLNANLKNLHIPMGEDNGVTYYTHYGAPYNWPAHYLNWILVEDGMPYAQHVYTFPGYDTSWSSWADRYNKMRNYYQLDWIINRTIPALPPKHHGSRSNTENATEDVTENATEKATENLPQRTPRKTSQTTGELILDHVIRLLRGTKLQMPSFA